MLNFTTVKPAGLNDNSVKHAEPAIDVCLIIWRKTVSIILMCIHTVVSLTICSCVSAYNVKIVV